MSALRKKSTPTLIASILFLLTFSVFAAGIEDITGYQPPARAGGSVAPYTIQDIINNLPSALDDDGIYKGRWVEWNDPKAVATDEENFGKCEYFYIRLNGKMGGHTFEWTLHYLFPENEAQKITASEVIKRNFAEIERETNSEYGVKACADWRNYSANLKVILNAVIQAAPAILKEKQRRIEFAQTEKLNKQNQAKEKTRAKQLAEEKDKADKLAMVLAESKGREEREKNLKSCQATSVYKLHEVSASIAYNKTIANDAEQKIQHQKEVEKISGYVDKQVMYEMGDRIVGANKLNKENFEVYKKLGGTESSVESVRMLPNPCKF